MIGFNTEYCSGQCHPSITTKQTRSTAMTPPYSLPLDKRTFFYTVLIFLIFSIFTEHNLRLLKRFFKVNEVIKNEKKNGNRCYSQLQTGVKFCRDRTACKAWSRRERGTQHIFPEFSTLWVPRPVLNQIQLYTAWEEIVWAQFYLHLVFRMHIFQGKHLSVGFSASSFSLRGCCFVDRESRPCKTRLLMWLNSALLANKDKQTNKKDLYILLVWTDFWKYCWDVNKSILKRLVAEESFIWPSFYSTPEFSSIHSNSKFHSLSKSPKPSYFQ